MMDTTSNDDRTSTASSISGIYRNILQTPAPICMFYFSHPFGISTPVAIQKHDDSNSSSSETPPYRKNLIRQIAQEKCSNSTNDENRYIPWPKDTWKRDYILPPLVQYIARKKGKNLPDLETIINSIRQAWNTPNNRSLLNSRAQEESSSSSSIWNFENNSKMGSGTYSGIIGAGPGLLRRRYSVPEIIMRKHSLSQQKLNDENVITNEPTPRFNSPTPRSPEIVISSGSDSNLSRGGGYIYNSNNSSGGGNSQNYYNGGGNYNHYGGEREISMRKSTLLRRIWSRELRRHDVRSGSWSPPLRRSNRRIHQIEQQNLPFDNQCLECKKLEEDYNNVASPKRIKLTKNNTTISPNQSTTTTASTFNKNYNENSSVIETITTDRTVSSSERQVDTSTTPTTTTSTHSEPTEFENNNFLNSNPKNGVYIYMTSAEDSSRLTTGDSNQDILHVEIDDNITNNNNNNNNSSDETQKSTSSITTDSGNPIESCGNNGTDLSDYNQQTSIATTYTTKSTKTTSSTIKNGTNSKNLLKKKIYEQGGVDQFISKLLIDNLNNVYESVNDSKSVSELLAKGKLNKNLCDDGKNTTRSDSLNSTTCTEKTISSSQLSANTMNITNNRIGINDDDDSNDYDSVVNECNYSVNILNSVNNNNNINNVNCNTNNNSNRTIIESEVSQVYLTPEVIEDIVSYRNLNENYVFEGLNESNSVHFTANEDTIYFPKYSPESRGDLSSRTSLASEPEPQEIIHVGTGSVYPFNGVHLVIIPRLSAIPRTESMEVQASADENNDDDIRSEDSISLVDSLDEPGTPPGVPKKERQIQSPTNSSKISISMDGSQIKTPREKGESFFVPITDEYDIMDEQLVVAESMPDKLREKLQRRHMELDAKREMEFHKHFNSSNESYKTNSNNFNGSNKVKKNSIIVLSEPTIMKTESITTLPSNKSHMKYNNKSNSKNLLRNEIGMLESYTIDGKGNMQFGGINGKTETSAIKILPPTQPIMIQQRRSTNPTSKKFLKNNKNEILTVKRSQTEKTTVKENNQKKKITKDVQSLTLYQTQTDLTPDLEGGPRRMYQKTEIQDNGKRIEILEIVECIDSSPDTSPNRPRSYRKILRSGGGSSSITPITSTNSSKKSMIPMPVLHKPTRIVSHPKRNTMKSSSSLSSTNTTTTSYRDDNLSNKTFSSKSAIRVLPSTNTSGNPGKVDRAIADILIDVINNPNEAGVEVLQSPKEKIISRKNEKNKKSSNNNNNNNKKQQQQPVVNTTNTRYTHKFEVIPEERSSVSIDSSNDERKSKYNNHKKLEIIKNKNNSNQNKQNNENNNFNNTKDKFIILSSSPDNINKAPCDSVKTTTATISSSINSTSSTMNDYSNAVTPSQSINTSTSHNETKNNDIKSDYKAFDVINNNNNNNNNNDNIKSDVIKNNDNNNNNLKNEKIKSQKSFKNNENMKKHNKLSITTVSSPTITVTTNATTIGNTNNTSSPIGFTNAITPSKMRKSPSRNDENLDLNHLFNKSQGIRSNSVNRSREAVVRDVDDVESKAWIGFFKKHDGSPIDSPNEDDQNSADSNSSSKQSIKSKNNLSPKAISQVIHSPIPNEMSTSMSKPISTNGTNSMVITTPSTIVNSMDNNYTTTPGSDQFTSIIDKTFDDTKLVCSNYLTECVNKGNCVQCNIDDRNFNENHKKCIQSKKFNASMKGVNKKDKNDNDIILNNDELPMNGCNCIERQLPPRINEMNVWQVCDSNDCKMIQSKIDSFEPVHGKILTIHSDAETIDSNSFIIYRDPILDSKTTNEENKPEIPELILEKPKKKSPKKKITHSKSSFDENQIICHDLEHKSNHIDGNLTQRSEISNQIPIEIEQKKENPNPINSSNSNQIPRENCIDCCFCNPDLHRNTSTAGKSIPGTASTICNLCKKKQSTPQTETPRIEIDDESKDSRSNLSYEIMSKTDHVHTKTKFRKNSDVISTKCTKTNQKIQRSFLPADSAFLHVDETNSNLYSPKSNISTSSNEPTAKLNNKKKTKNHINRPKDINNLPRTKSLQSVQKIMQDEINLTNGFHNNHKKTKSKSHFRLPNPYDQGADHDDDDDDDNDNAEDDDNNISSSQFDYDDTSSVDSSDSSLLSCSPNNKKNKKLLMQNAANRWRQNAYHKYYSSKRWLPKNKQNNDDYEYYDNKTPPDLNRNKSKWGPKTTDNSSNEAAPGNNTNQGWSVTVAGNCTTEMAPDVEMRLRFPNQIKYETNFNYTENTNKYLNEMDNEFFDNYTARYNHPEDFKYRNQQIEQNGNFLNNKKHALPPPTGNTMNMNMNNNNNNNNNEIMKRNLINNRNYQKDYCNLPDVHNGNAPQSTITKQTSKKAIKKVECSVAVTSATRTVSNIPPSNKRAMSYQSICVPDTGRQGIRRRDRSIDLGTTTTASSRRMSFDSQTPSDSRTLSVMGNAIAPEKKPKVPTMSEKDLTRRHSSCFTRNRAFLT